MKYFWHVIALVNTGLFAFFVYHIYTHGLYIHMYHPEFPDKVKVIVEEFNDTVELQRAPQTLQDIKRDLAKDLLRQGY